MEKVMWFSDFPLILMIYRETKCLFEISIDGGVKINVAIKKRKVFYKRLDAKITFFLIDRRGGGGGGGVRS